jgi:hypothetical protein
VVAVGEVGMLVGEQHEGRSSNSVSASRIGNQVDDAAATNADPVSARAIGLGVPAREPTGASVCVGGR